MYDEKKLKEYWAKKQAKKELQEVWRKNGWDGSSKSFGRNVKLSCGCFCWYGWSVAEKDVERCYYCPETWK